MTRLRRPTSLVASLLALLIGGWLALAAVPVPAQDASSTVGPASTERITAELVSMTGSATPGSTLILAVRQDIEPDWHTYWRNPGDSGGATTLDWALPEGWEAGDIVWPLPERQPLSGLMNYGYSDVVYLPVPITVPADAEPGQMLDLSVTALFLVCSAEMCVPDELTLGLRLPVGPADQTPLETRHASAIQAVLESSPRPAGLTARIASTDDGGLTLAVTGEAVQGADCPGLFLSIRGRDHRPCRTPDRDLGPRGAEPGPDAGRQGSRRWADRADRRSHHHRTGRLRDRRRTRPPARWGERRRHPADRGRRRCCRI